MVRKSHGFKKGTRNLFKTKKKMTINEKLKKFNIGDVVNIDANPSSRSLIYKRFQGKTGKVVGTRGSAYIIEFYDGNKLKKIIANAEHLKLNRGVAK